MQRYDPESFCAGAGAPMDSVLFSQTATAGIGQFLAFVQYNNGHVCAWPADLTVGLLLGQFVHVLLDQRWEN